MHRQLRLLRSRSGPRGRRGRLWLVDSSSTWLEVLVLNNLDRASRYRHYLLWDAGIWSRGVAKFSSLVSHLSSMQKSHLAYLAAACENNGPTTIITITYITVGSMIYQSSSLPLIILLFQFLSFSALVKTATSSSSSSRSRYAAYDYDLTTPQYTPDGRLLQVEYATNACRGGEGRNPIVCVGMSIPSQRDVLLYAKRQNQKRREQKEQQLNESDGQRNSELECTDNDGKDSFSEGQGLEGDALLIMATISSPPPSSSTSLIIDSKHKTDGDDKEKQSSSTIEQQSNYINQQRTQCRIIEVPLSTSFQTHYYGKTSSTTTTESTSILIGLSGILADATSLLQIAYSVLEEEQISFGWHRLGLSPVGTTTVAAVGSNGSNDDDNNVVTKSQVHPRRQQQQQQTAAAAQPSETTVRLARAIGDRCQKHAFGGGLRPLGASLMIAGIEQQQQQSGSGSSIKFAMCETDPSGAISVMNPFWVRPTTSTTSSAEGDVGNAEDKLVINSPRVMVSGGATQSRSKLKQTMTLRTRDLYDDIIMNSKKEETKKRVIYSEEVFLRRALQTVIEALVEEWKGRGSIPSLSGDNSKREQSMVLPQMEVVFTTPKRGTFRLSEDDIRVLMESTDK